MQVKNEEQASYSVDLMNAKLINSCDEDTVIAKALEILAGRMRKPGAAMTSPAAVRSFLQLKLGGSPHEVFAVLFLGVQNQVIAFEEMFRGSLAQCSVYPRDVVKAALDQGAAAVVLSHNHPSGSVRPSRADEALTRTLKSALALVDVRVLDHVIVSGSDSLSMAEHGLI